MRSQGYVDVGHSPRQWPDTEITIVNFHQYTNSLPRARGESLETWFASLGMRWKLVIFPGGHEDSNDGMVALGICCELNDDPRCEFRAQVMISIKKPNGQHLDNAAYEDATFASSFFPQQLSDEGPYFTGEEDTWVVYNFICHQELVQVLNNGTLVLEVCIRTHPGYRPLLMSRQSIAEAFMEQWVEENEPDIAFRVGKQKQVIHAHQAVLKTGAPNFHELAKEFSLTNPFPVDDVDPEIFQLMIDYIYGERIFDSTFWENECAKFIANDNGCIIKACDKYGLEALKNDAETWMLMYLIIDSEENARAVEENAKRYNLRRLKEAALAWSTQSQP